MRKTVKIESQLIYSSSNGDRWLLIPELASDRRLVRHEPNPSSGGLGTDMELDEFMRWDGQSPQGDALRVLLGTKPIPEETPKVTEVAAINAASSS